MKRISLITSLLFCTTSLLIAQAVDSPTPMPPDLRPGSRQDTLLQDEGMVFIDDFYIDIYEYPNQQGVLPKVNITYGQADKLCAAISKRLCSEQEWQRAATGPENYPYSYGEIFESARCNTPQHENDLWIGGASLAPSGAFAQCHNSYGLYDMVGNVWEWTSSWYSPDKKWRAVRGGSYFHSANMSRTDARYGRYLDDEYHLDLVGFRCCRSTLSQRPAAE
jgi:eukaryotic-like serine/threonine-protein kinase